MLKIAFIGNHQQPFCTEQDYCWELRELGHEVVEIQEQMANIDETMRTIEGTDLVLYSHTHNWPVLDIFDGCNSLGIPTATYHLDLFAKGVEKQREVGSSAYWKVKYFFTVDPNMVPTMNERDDLPTGFFLPPGVISRDCYIAEPEAKLMQDVVFVGSKGYHQTWPYRGQLLSYLENTYGDRYTHWGNDGKRYIRMEELNKVYSSSLVTVGDSLCPDFTYYGYLSDRPFETTGRGGFLIMPRVPGIEEFWEEDKEMVFYDFGDFAQLKEKTDYYVAHDEEREAIRLAGHERTKNNYTYKYRLTSMLNTLAEHEPQLKDKI